MHTPDQAKQLWCPMVRLSVCGPDGGVPLGATVLNRLQIGDKTSTPDSSGCIGERCAMWRWVPGKGSHTERRVIPRPGGGADLVAERVLNASTHGYCGLAGNPGVMP